MHSDEETPIALRTNGVAGLAVGRVAVGEDIAGVKNIVHGQIDYGKIPLDGHDLTGRKAQVVDRRRAVGEEGFASGIKVRATTGVRIRQARAGGDFLKPPLRNQTGVMVGHEGRGRGLLELLKK